MLIAAALPAGFLGFALTAPIGCTHAIADGISESYESIDCTSIVGLEFPSYTTAQPAVFPPYWPAALVGLGVAAIVYVVARRRYTKPHPVND